MSWGLRIRQLHRWTSVVFTLAVMLNFGAMAVAPEAVWVAFLAIPPLLVLLATGCWLFVLPYVNAARAER